MSKINLQLQGKTPRERATIKGAEIAKIVSTPRLKRSIYDIEIVNIKATEIGVEVFARVWDKGEQIGFGRDGTVDIERFIVCNPPILVEDSNGDVVELYTDINGVEKRFTYREDPKEAILQSIEHTIQVKREKFGSEKIVKGKIGSTTSTFYPDASAVDGDVFQSLGAGSGVSWSSLVGAAGNGSSTSPSTGNIFTRSDSGSGNWRQMFRFVTMFDTSSIPDTDIISSATISYWGNVVDANTFSLTLNVTAISPASTTALVNSDYATISNTKFATGIGWGSLVTGAYNNLTFNASGIAAISKTGISKFVARNENDIDNSSPTWTGSAAQNFEVKGSASAGTTNDPKLVVEHAAASGPANLKTYNTNPKANIKTINTNPIANVKSLNTNT